MRKNFVTIAIILIFLVGLSVLLYPYVADFINSRNQSKAVASYREAVSNMSEQDLSGLREAALEYNMSLSKKPDRFSPSEDEHMEYNSLLNVTTSGIMGTLEIEAIDVSLPIYHGTSEGVLQVGIGHFEGSSLPIGGIGTHAVITGHRGLPSSTLLTNLDRMEIGDSFVLRVLNETLWYQVDQILVVEPHDLSALGMAPDKDYCTLITCTPYGINSHRMLVRGFRVDAPEPNTSTAPQTSVRAEANRVNAVLPLTVVLAPITVILVSYKVIRFKIRKKKGTK